MAGWVRGTVLEGPAPELGLHLTLTRRCLATLSARRPSGDKIFGRVGKRDAFEKSFLGKPVKEMRKTEAGRPRPTSASSTAASACFLCA